MADARQETRDGAMIRHPDDIEYVEQEVAPGQRKGVLFNEEQHGMPNLALRRFTLDPGATAPKHYHEEIEHEQYVLEGEYVVGIDDTEYTVGPGDSIYIPARTVHWYRNEGDDVAAFICAIPNGDDSPVLVE